MAAGFRMALRRSLGHSPYADVTVGRVNKPTGKLADQKGVTRYVHVYAEPISVNGECLADRHNPPLTRARRQPLIQVQALFGWQVVVLPSVVLLGTSVAFFLAFSLFFGLLLIHTYLRTAVASLSHEGSWN